MCIKKRVKLINHDCLPILMLLYKMLYIVLAYLLLYILLAYLLLYILLAYLLLYIVLAYLMLFAALSNAVCLHNAYFLPMIYAIAFYLPVVVRCHRCGQWRRQDMKT